jgi:hypothetical protein
MIAATTLVEALGQFRYMASGAVIGAPVGYAVLVIQDRFIPQGVPLLIRGL